VELFKQFAYGDIDRAGRSVVDAMWMRRPAWAVASISDMDAAFFAGLVIETRPRKLVEVGVASGWGSCVLLEALRVAGLTASELYGVDISDRFFYDQTYATGQSVREVFPEHLPRYHLLTNMTIGTCAPKIGDGIDFAFIDAHHMHPWATLDLPAVMPFMSPASWVALHDLSLSRKEDQEHRNRGPKYLYEGWDGDKAHSVQKPPMAGAIRLSESPLSHLPLLLDVLYTPWELTVDAGATESVCAVIETAFGQDWAGKFRRAIEVGNYHANKMHSPDIDRLQQQLAALRAGGGGLIRKLFGERAS
jgi:predicted O-methyltransferase YrrM